MTLAEKIIAAHCGKAVVSAGEFVCARVDIVLANDITAPLGIESFKALGIKKVFDPHRIVLVPDHFTPNKDIKSAHQCKVMREFAAEQAITHYFEIGQMGIEHALLPEKGIVVPGDLIVGADSHTCTYGALCAFSTGVGSTDFAAAMATGEVWLKVPETIRFVYSGKLNRWVSGKDLVLYTIGMIGVDGALYKVMQFEGPVISNLPMDDRFTMSNMAIEAGGKAGLIPFDDITRDYVDGRAERPYLVYQSDEYATYEQTHEIDCSAIKPQVALPHLPSNTVSIDAIEKIEIDQVVIGSCTNGRLSDLRIAAQIMRGRKVHSGVRVIVIPATQNIYLEAIREGLVEDFVHSGAVVSTPTCGPCLGGHMGILAEGERAVATTNRNFVGRMGHPRSEVYLANPAIAAASAILGYIASPDEL
jgi:3-isopropylmalate/(R)-2-methylmalate dehydratase large subunit